MISYQGEDNGFHHNCVYDVLLRREWKFFQGNFSVFANTKDDFGDAFVSRVDDVFVLFGKWFLKCFCTKQSSDW